MKRFSKIKAFAMALIMAVAVAVPIALAQSEGTDRAGKKERRAERGAFGKHRGNHRGRFNEGMLGGRLMKQLELTDAQKAQLAEIRKRNHESLQPLRKQIHEKRREMRSSSADGTFNESVVRQKLTEIAGLEAKLMAERFKVQQEMLTVLTTEQREKLNQMREQFKARRAERRSKSS